MTIEENTQVIVKLQRKAEERLGMKFNTPSNEDPMASEDKGNEAGQKTKGICFNMFFAYIANNLHVLQLEC